MLAWLPPPPRMVSGYEYIPPASCPTFSLPHPLPHSLQSSPLHPSHRIHSARIQYVQITPSRPPSSQGRSHTRCCLPCRESIGLQFPPPSLPPYCCPPPSPSYTSPSHNN